MVFSLSSWKKSSNAADGAPASASGGSNGGGMRNKAMVLIAVLGVGALGYKIFWPDSEPVKASAAMPKMTAPARQVGSALPKPGAKPTPRVKDNARTNAGATDGYPARPAPAATAVQRSKAKAAAADDDTDIPTREEIAKPPPQSDPATATKSPTASPASASNDILAPAFVDENNGFSIRFPTAWAIRTFASEPWVLDCGDGRTALISVGFSAFPADFTADNIPPEWVARRIKKRSDTTLHSQGYALIGGKKALWSKSTGPLPMTNGNPRMTRVNYIVPLHDGRVMELRIATTPEIFDQLMPTMRQSVESFKFIPRVAAPATH